MKILLLTPAKKGSKNGNRTSALRWAKLLRKQGHRVDIKTDYNGESTDLVIALHAWRSAAAIARYRASYARGHLIVALGGTDVNTFLKTDPETTLKSMREAHALVCLHDLISLELPLDLRSKLRVIYQSAQDLSQPRQPRQGYFDVLVIGHLRAEKDPFRCALAAGLMPASSRLRVLHFGKAHSPEWAEQASQHTATNVRYQWCGEVPGWRIRRELARCQLMVISSRQEGGANVVSEALVAGVPIIASDIPGNTGLLGADYPGYYALADEVALASLLARAENDRSYLSILEKHCVDLAPKFSARRESEAWAVLINEVSQVEPG